MAIAGQGYSSHKSSATHSGQSVCRIFLCPNNAMAARVFVIFNVCTDVDACDCTRGLCYTVRGSAQEGCVTL